MCSIVLVIFLIFAFSAEIHGQSDCLNPAEFTKLALIRPIVKLNTSDLCYWAYSQGPCAEGEWLPIAIDSIKIPNSTRIGICETRRCFSNEVTDWEFPTFTFLHNDLCMTTDDINENFCGSNSTKVYYGEEDDKPFCSEIRPTPIDGRFLGGWFDTLAGRDPKSIASKNTSTQHRKNIKG